MAQKTRAELIEKRFGNLVVVQYVGNSRHKKAQWLCECDCGGSTVTISSQLINGRTKSCGCYRNKRASESNIKPNRYDLTGSYGIGYTQKNEEFCFDLEDYEKIKDYCWGINKDGYVVTRQRGTQKNLFFHHLVFGRKENHKVDHVGQNKNDNRKKFLRFCTTSQNGMNQKLRKSNISGCPGVTWDNRYNKWRVQITINNKEKWLGYFTDLMEAITTRKNAEEKYFKEFSYDNSQKLSIEMESK